MADVFGRGGVFGRGSGVRPQRSMAMGMGGVSFVDREDPLLDPLSKKFQAGEDMTDAEIAALQAALGSKQYGLFSGKKEREADAALRGQILAESDRLAERSLERQAGIQDRITGKREAGRMREAIAGQAPIMSEADIAIFNEQLAGMSPAMLRQIEGALKQQAGEQQIVDKLIMDAAAAGVAPGSALNTPEERGALLGQIGQARDKAAIARAAEMAGAQSKAYAEDGRQADMAKALAARQQAEAEADAIDAIMREVTPRGASGPSRAAMLGGAPAPAAERLGPNTPEYEAALQNAMNKFRSQQLRDVIEQMGRPQRAAGEATISIRVPSGQTDEFGEPVLMTIRGTPSELRAAGYQLPTGQAPSGATTMELSGGSEQGKRQPIEYKRFRVY